MLDIKFKTEKILEEVNKVIAGKEKAAEKVLAAILAQGHVLLEDVPGVGKTTLALAFSKAMGFDFNRVQFTPDVVPSDITGFSMYDKKTGEFKYMEGAAMCNFFLADEINRTSSKTQSALLEVMQEGNITVDGTEHRVPKPFVVMGTQNPVGTAGTQMLPEAQLDRFMIQLSMGYPSKSAQIKILRDREQVDPIDKVEQVTTPEEIIKMQDQVKDIYIDEKILEFITDLTEETRNNEKIKLGISPRGAIAIMQMAKAVAYIHGYDYVVPEHVTENFHSLAEHRIILAPMAQMDGVDKWEVIDSILKKVKAPVL